MIINNELKNKKLIILAVTLLLLGIIAVINHINEKTIPSFEIIASTPKEFDGELEREIDWIYQQK